MEIEVPLPCRHDVVRVAERTLILHRRLEQQRDGRAAADRLSADRRALRRDAEQRRGHGREPQPLQDQALDLGILLIMKLGVRQLLVNRGAHQPHQVGIVERDIDPVRQRLANRADARNGDLHQDQPNVLIVLRRRDAEIGGVPGDEIRQQRVPGGTAEPGALDQVPDVRQQLEGGAFAEPRPFRRVHEVHEYVDEGEAGPGLHRQGRHVGLAHRRQRSEPGRRDVRHLGAAVQGGDGGR
jgi:hypothetical protein